MRKDRNAWNHNIHYYDKALAAAPTNTRAVLDVGTGDGLLAMRLAERYPEVTGIDSDADIIARARTNGPADITWITGDVLTYNLPEAHYDLVVAVATVHHFPELAVGLERLAELTAADGALVVIGCARSSSAYDFAFDLIGTAQHQVLSRTRGFWQHNAPIRMQFPHTFGEVRQIATAVLPGMKWRRLPLWRYSITWHKPS